MYGIFWGFRNTWHPNNRKRKYYYYTVHIGALPVCGIIADIDQISTQLNGSFICMYRIFWDFGNTWHTFVYST